MTRKQAIELIKRTHYGGLVPVDASHSDREVNLMLNMGIAVAAQRALMGNIQVDNEEFIGDAFYVTLAGLTVGADNSVELGYTPTSANIGISVSNIKVTGLEKQPIPISSKEIFLWDELPMERGRIAYHINGSKLQFLSKISLSGKTMSARFVGVPDANNLDDELNVPADTIAFCVEYVVGLLDKRRQEDIASRTGKG
jgi:hypothetical protein